MLFDMDGLLLDFERLVVDCFEKTVAEFGLKDMSGVVHSMIGLRADASEVILRGALEGHHSYDAFHVKWQALIHAPLTQGIPLKTGVVELLKNLSSQGLPCVVATSTQTKTAQRHLETAGILHFSKPLLEENKSFTENPPPTSICGPRTTSGFRLQTVPLLKIAT